MRCTRIARAGRRTPLWLESLRIKRKPTHVGRVLEASRDRAHPLVLAASTGTDRESQPHDSRSSRERAEGCRCSDPGEGQRVSPRPVQRGLQRDLRGGSSRSRVAFVALGRVDLESVLCHEEERVVGGQHGRAGGRPAADRQTARTTQLRRATGPHSPGSAGPAQCLARDAVPRSLRLAGASGRRGESRMTGRVPKSGRPTGSLRPALSPGNPPTGQITCQTGPDTSLVNNRGGFPEGGFPGFEDCSRVVFGAPRFSRPRRGG